ncbi:MAG TPA: DUF551 domain-containing protein [Vitreimonas sp.]|nr:DUF551 domain-containing protein [Vitreimonas sp.]
MEWIDVNEMLPIREGHYLVAYRTDDCSGVSAYDYDGQDWLLDGEPLFCKSFFIEVNYWMPLPPLPDVLQPIQFTEAPNEQKGSEATNE